MNLIISSQILQNLAKKKKEEENQVRTNYAKEDKGNNNRVTSMQPATQNATKILQNYRIYYRL